MTLKLGLASGSPGNIDRGFRSCCAPRESSSFSQEVPTAECSASRAQLSQDLGNTRIALLQAAANSNARVEFLDPVQDPSLIFGPATTPCTCGGIYFLPKDGARLQPDGRCAGKGKLEL